MRVLHFFKTYWPDTFGGVERTIHAIAKGTAKYGIQSDVLSLSSMPEQNTREFDGHIAHKAKLDFEFASTGFSWEVFGRFRELSDRADIVHYHFPWPVMDVVHLTSRLRKPTVVTYHSDIVKQRILLQLYRPLMHRFLTSVDRIVATSPNYLATSDVLQRYRSKTTVIPLGLDEGDYPRASDDVKARWRQRFPKPFFLFVGVLRYYKGVHILLEAAKQTDHDILLIGQGPMEASLKAYAKEHSLENVHFLGALPDADKAALLELSTGLVFPSHLRSEAFGLSLVEAAMFGKPMISCEIGTGTSFVNVHGETGVVVKPNDPDALAGAMIRLSRRRKEALGYGEKARAAYLEKFTAVQMTADYASVYRDIVGR
ncbi:MULTISPECIES: glycosyltransferase family 4 protein [Rhizobium]|nr:MULTISPECIES: glycosyltransferase family 4 protein [Rhizobium]MCA0805696.1 glycosyltransferase family 4 protein [Rhizobium sp. T1473]MCS0463700.1 glycosyltransferase family 4 protein [Rhizobium favelukesii]UFS80583.1 glycosyltransferase family 4 protein [Rhizobium sp. T136]